MWSGSDVKKVAEVYEFYAAYKSAQNKTISANSYTFSDRVHAGDDDGYNKHNPITSGDPHYGWNIGSFVISGFTRKTEENGIPVFIKKAGHDDKPGDNIELWFKLEQKDLKKLNGDSDLYLAEDTNGYDEYFEYEKTNLKHGALFIRQTDNTNTKSKVIAYTDFLAALCSPAANTKIGLFEEGDYEVALDYQVNKKGIFDDENDYCIL